MIITETKIPVYLWFGNFYRPAFDDREFVRNSIKKIKELGFNAVELDSKAWADFADRFAGKPASDYVAMQEYMMECLKNEKLGRIFLALYLNGDNLYPNIRFSPPVRGESVTNPDGSDGKHYKYWSDKAQQAQTDHVAGLMRTYPEGNAEITMEGRKRLPICSMWDPVVAPSFDAEGTAHYRQWLQDKYQDIHALNSAYGLDADTFDALRPEDYWYTVRYGSETMWTPEDLKEMRSPFRVWADNMQWRADELAIYFAKMEKKLHQIDPELYLMPNLTQWSHFLNIDTSVMPDVGLCDLWDTANRGIDMRMVAPHVDMCHWYTLPVTMDGEPDAYVVSCQHAHMRALNPGRQFLGGVYWGRFLYNDIYRFITPEETIGSIAASGASGIAAYGWCGLDDGGILHRMDESFLESLRLGNEWLQRVIPQTGKKEHSRVGILFPTEMSLYEPLAVKGAAENRFDLLGIYRLCCDLGIFPEIVEAQDASEVLPGLDILLMPANDCYHVRRSAELEKALRKFTENGGTIIHSSNAECAAMTFGLKSCPVEDTAFTCFGEGCLTGKGNHAAWEGKPLAVWRKSGLNAVTENRFGNGRVISFGFLPGEAYAARKAPHVPPEEHNNELYPFTHVRHNLLKDLLAANIPENTVQGTDVETACFENGMVVINHRSTAVRIPESIGIISDCTRTEYNYGSLLPGHAAAWIRKGREA